jgi:hypothetical protein
MEFSQPLQSAVDLMALSPNQAWDLEVLMLAQLEPTIADVELCNLVNLVNRPVETMQRQ